MAAVAQKVVEERNGEKAQEPRPRIVYSKADAPAQTQDNPQEKRLQALEDKMEGIRAKIDSNERRIAAYKKEIELRKANSESPSGQQGFSADGLLGAFAEGLLFGAGRTKKDDDARKQIALLEKENEELQKEWVRLRKSGL